MLQQVEYEPGKFAQWLARVPQLNRTMRRKKLVLTTRAKLLVMFSYAIAILYMIGTLVLAIWLKQFSLLVLLLLTPLVVLLLLFAAVLLAWVFVEQPRRQHHIKQSEKVFKQHTALKIAIAGSYGKTTVKELLTIVLSQGKKVAATPGNQNVPTSHARWVNSLDGDEDILLIEYGEAAPGDIGRFATTTHPDIGVITGLAPNHLEHYKTLQALVNDFIDLATYLRIKQTYINGESKELGERIQHSAKTVFYNREGLPGVKISHVEIALEGMKFQAQVDGRSLYLHTKLVGRHLLGPLALCIDIAHKAGLNDEQIKQGISLATPFEHRMQPRLVHSAWIIDDTYNGSLEGIRAGLELLKELPAKRKIYVTPGLVDQGAETGNVHFEIGRLIAEARPDQVILMKNSVTLSISQGLKQAGYKGELIVRPDPLEFYTNLEQYVAAGDLVMLQNDWTDNYA